MSYLIENGVRAWANGDAEGLVRSLQGAEKMAADGYKRHREHLASLQSKGESFADIRGGGQGAYLCSVASRAGKAFALVWLDDPLEGNPDLKAEDAGRKLPAWGISYPVNSAECGQYLYAVGTMLLVFLSEPNIVKLLSESTGAVRAQAAASLAALWMAGHNSLEA